MYGESFFDYFIYILIAIYVIAWIAQNLLEMFFAKKCGVRLYGLVWLPIGKEYVLGQIADTYDNKIARRIYPILSGILYAFWCWLLVTSFIVTVGTNEYVTNLFGCDILTIAVACLAAFGFLILLSFMIYIYRCFVLYRIFCLKDRKNSVLWLVLFILLNLTHGFGLMVYLIFLCVYMNRQGIPKIIEMREQPVEEEIH